MSYMVVYQRADGSSGLEECSSLEVAVVAAERLRNVDEVESPRILRTEEIQFDFRPYYRVEVATGTEIDTNTPTEPPAPSTSLTPVPEPPSAPTEPVPVASDLPAAESSVPDLSAPVIDVPAGNEASIDPWAAVDGAAQGDEPDSFDEVTEPINAPEMPAEDTSDVEEFSSAARGLFSGEHTREPPKDLPDVAPLADDVNDAVPPRRGLFGR